MNKTRYEKHHWHLTDEELKLCDDDVLVLGNKFVEIDISEKDKKTFNQGLDYLDEILEDLT